MPIRRASASALGQSPRFNGVHDTSASPPLAAKMCPQRSDETCQYRTLNSWLRFLQLAEIIALISEIRPLGFTAAWQLVCLGRRGTSFSLAAALRREPAPPTRP